MKTFLLLLTISTLLFACKKDDGMAGTFESETVNFEAGRARSFVNLNTGGEPLQLGVTLNETALYSNPSSGSTRPHSIPLNDAVKNATPFQFVDICWNPHGHEPAGVYDMPHFDCHFYMMPEMEVMDINDTLLMNAVPAAEYLPQNYMGAGTLPMMGKHWVDLTSSEFTGQPFTQTFVYGTYNSEVNFYEPMLTLDFLKSTTGFERDIPQPAKFKKAGWYPTKMRVTKHDGLIDVTLESFVKREAS